MIFFSLHREDRMSSVTASDRSNQTDEIRRIREDYESKESESTKKKNKEIRQMNERHDKELARIKAEYDNQVATLRNKQSESIDERDRKHNDDVSRIRELYMDSLRKKTTDDMREKESMKSAFEQDLDKQKQISDQQKEILEKNIESTVNDKNRLITETEQRSNEEMRQAIDNNREKLNNRHNEELRAVSGDRDRVVSEMNKLVKDIKETDKNELETEKKNHRLEVERDHNSFETAIRGEHAMSSEVLNSKEKMLQDELGHLRNQYQKRMDDETERMQQIREQFAEQYEGRTGSKILKMKSDLAMAKNQQISDAISGKKSNEIEKKNIIQSYQDREEGLQKEKAQIYDSVNQVAHERIATANRSAEKLLSESNRRNKIEQQTSDMRYRDAFGQNEEVLKNQVLQSQNKAEERVRKVMKVSSLAQKNQLRLHEEGLIAIKDKHAEDLQNQREAQLESMKDMYERMDKRLKSAEQHLAKKHEDAIDFYENKIDSLEAQNREELQRLTKAYEARANQKEKAVKQEEGTITSKYEQKMALQEDVHRKELDRIEKRHQEQLQAVIARVNAAQKKV
jgi:hypothetical protein